MREPVIDREDIRKNGSCESDSGGGQRDERREFLKKCGKYAVYTTPVMLSLLFYDKKKAMAGVDIGSKDQGDPD